MNLGLYRSRFGLLAAGAVAALLAWNWRTGQAFGSRDDRNVPYLLATGWAAVACFVALALYAVRRAAHRLRFSPEFAWKASLPALERAQSELTELQNRVVRREVGTPRAIRREADRILRRHSVHRVLAVAIEPDPRIVGLLRVRAGPREALGRLAKWLHAHVYLGLAAALIVWFHGGLRSQSTIGLLLNVLSYVVIGSGVLGAVLWTVGPTWLTRAERDLSIEKAHALAAHYDRKVAEAVAALQQSGETNATALRRDLATLTGQRELVQAELRRLGFFRELLRFWRLAHVPCSILLLALVGVHVVGIWLY